GYDGAIRGTTMARKQAQSEISGSVLAPGESPDTSSKAHRKPHPNKNRIGWGRQFEKGHPYLGGKVKTMSLTGHLKAELAKIPDDVEDETLRGLTNAQIIARKYVEKARDGDNNAIKDIIDRIDGRAVQMVAGPGGGRIEMKQTKEIKEADLRIALKSLVDCGALKMYQG
ncbi:MAG TPA: hypothetical protein PKG66_09725, partial [Methanothrix sp.]|nr:hypothetical protein [Methanothrix sp.]